MPGLDEHTIAFIVDAIKEKRIAPITYDGKNYGLLVMNKNVTDERVVRRLLNDGVIRRVPKILMEKLRRTVVCAKKGTVVYLVEVE
jgi:hypothetical protein